MLEMSLSLTNTFVNICLGVFGKHFGKCFYVESLN